MLELMNLIGLTALLAALAMYGLARYVRHSKTAEAVGSTTGIAQAAAVYYDESDSLQPAGTKPDAAKAMRHFPPSSRASVPADLTDVRGKRYQSAVADWSVSPWLDMRFSISTPQYYAYSFESRGSGPSAQGTAEAHGDLDGNGRTSTFRAHVSADSTLTAKVDPAIERIDPEE